MERHREYAIAKSTLWEVQRVKHLGSLTDTLREKESNSEEGAVD